MRGGAAVTDRKGASDTMNPFEMAILMVYHPSDAFDEIKLKGKRQPVWPGAVILLAITYILFTILPPSGALFTEPGDVSAMAPIPF